MKTQIRIVAGALRGRKLSCNVNADLRPTPQMVREALFSILGNAVPGQVFVDLFAGTGVHGLEALSRGASAAYFVERDLRQAADTEKHLRAFGVLKQAKLFRTDAYRWVAAWQPPPGPVNVFISPPFADLESRPEEMVKALQALQEKLGDGSVIVLQSEKGAAIDDDPTMLAWERRTYGRNVLLLWQRDDDATEGEAALDGEAVQPNRSADEE